MHISIKCVLRFYLIHIFAGGQSVFNGADKCEEKESGECLQKDTDVSSKYKNNAQFVNLTRLTANQVGETIVLANVHNERELTMKTISNKPVIFEIEEFLSASECKHLIQLALNEGLKDSSTHKEPEKEDVQSYIRIMDVDGDDKLTISEMMLTLENSFDIYFDDDDIIKMYTDLKMDSNQDQLIERHELQSTSPETLTKYLETYIIANPVKKSRLSKQAWLYPSESKDAIFKDIQARVQRLTKLPDVLISKSDFQVVNYGPNGHYNAHIDSGHVDKSVPCCYRGISPFIQCRLCRFVTVLFYLNDVELGGGTAFPVARNESFDESVLRNSHKINLHRHCHDANLIVTPKRGKAVMWYNHKIDESGWLGTLDTMTWHGGCPVIKGEKWIANFWIKVTEDRVFDLKPLKRRKK